MDNKLLEILACPVCKGELEYLKREQELLCHKDKLAFPIKDGVPVMIVDQAREIKQ